MKSKDLIIAKGGYVISSYKHTLPGLVLSLIPSPAGWLVEYLGTDGRIYKKPARWFQSLKKYEER